MKKVITYGTFDLLHKGHINILKRAKELGDYLIVGVTTDNYDKARGKLNVQNSLMKRIEDVKKLNIADEIIIEEYEGQKIDDITKYSIDTFVIGSDWTGKFDYLNSYCEVIYLERTKGVSSTELRQLNTTTIRLGIIGSGRIAQRFVLESKYVSGVEVTSVFNPRLESARCFGRSNELELYTDNLELLFDNVDAVYVATPHSSHYQYSLAAIKSQKHVLCEKPLTLTKQQSIELYRAAQENNVVLAEAIKTAYCPSFGHLCSLVRSGCIGEILEVRASFSMIKDDNLRELNPNMDGGSITELVSYPLLPIFKLLGTDYKNITFYSRIQDQVDYYTTGVLQYQKALGLFTVALKAKTEGELIITGTKGYAYVPAPWWKTSYFEIRYEDTDKTQKYFHSFEGDGLRYEISEFLQSINKEKYINHKLTERESVKISEIIETFRNGVNVNHL